MAVRSTTWQVALQDLQVGDAVKAHGVLVLCRIAIVDAVHLGRLEEHVGVESPSPGRAAAVSVVK